MSAMIALGFTLACGGAETPPVEDVEDGKTEREAPTPGAGASWWVDGDEAKGGTLAGAVMDLWGGDPGPICFKGEAKAAANKAKKSFAGSDNLVSSKAKGASVTITTRSPFGDGTTSPSKFESCP